MKEQIKAPKIELSDEEIANLSDAQFKTLIIRMLTEMAEYGHKIEEKVKTTKIEIKGTVLPAQLSADFHSLPLLPTSKVGLFGADSQVGGFLYILGPCGSLQ